jgi:phosphate:Na+ symporter
MVKNIKEDDSEVAVRLDNRILNNTNFATASCLNEIIRMGKLAKKNLKISIESLFVLDENKFNDVIVLGEKINTINHAITKYLVKICTATSNRKDNKFLIFLFHIVEDIKIINDHCQDTIEIAKFMLENEIEFNESSKSEIKEIFNMTILCYTNSLTSIEKNNEMLAQQSIPMVENITTLEKYLRDTHIECLSNDQCDAKTNIAFLNTISNLKIVAEHSLNMAQVILHLKPVKITEV